MRNIAIDFETSRAPHFLPWQPQAFAVCMSTCNDDNETRTWFFNHPVAESTIAEAVAEINDYLSSYDRVIAHNADFDLHWARALSINLDTKKLWCTLVTEYLIREHGNIQQLSLEELSVFYGLPAKKDKVKVYWDADVNTDEIPADVLQVYCEQDAVNALAIFRRQYPQVKDKGLMPLVSLEMEVLRCVEDMEWNGMAVDLERCAEEAHAAETRLEEIEHELQALLGIANPRSSHQLSIGLFGGTLTVEEYQDTGEVFKSGQRKGEPRYRKVEREVRIVGAGFSPLELGIPETAVKGIYSVSKEVALPKLKAKTPEQQRIIQLMYEQSSLAKLYSGYYNSLPKLVVGRCVHGNLNQALTVTGRFSCSSPNLQNIPRGASPVKKLFITRYE